MLLFGIPVQRLKGSRVQCRHPEAAMSKRIAIRCGVFLAWVMFSLLPAGRAHAQTPNYQGKTVTIIVGTGAGDLYDLYARSIALFMGKYLPGNPNVIVQNMPGAGHMIAATISTTSQNRTV